jgi:hypothetical protein
MKRFLRNNGLSLVLLVMFLAFWGAQSVAGFHVFNDDQALHGNSLVSYANYLGSGHFWQATGENWESEFLQMGFYVILTSFLFQKGSAESNDPDDAEQLAASRHKKRATWLYRNSLSLAFLALFMMAFAVHAMGGLAEVNQEHAEHGEPLESVSGFLSGSEFWFQSFQNWQSEFLAVLSIVILSIFLRQDGSPESKDVDEPNSKTGA